LTVLAPAKFFFSTASSCEVFYGAWKTFTLVKISNDPLVYQTFGIETK